MAEVFVRNRRTQTRRHGRYFGEVPLSSGEIEYLTQKDEAARRRQRLLQVREQEKRAAQLVTQRYRENLKKLQGYRFKYAQQEHLQKQEMLLSTLHDKYQNSLQGMGTAQRNAREKVAQLIELAHVEKRKWAVNRCGEKERFEDAVDLVRDDTAVRLARRREIERNLLRLKQMSTKQRSEASARAKRELETQLQLHRAQEEAQLYRLQHAEIEEFSYPRKTQKDVAAYHFTRTHCVALPENERNGFKTTAGATGESNQVKIVRHNRVQRTVPSAVDQAEEYRQEMERKKEAEWRVREENARVAAARGDGALHVVESIREGEQALEWLESMDHHGRVEAGLNAVPDNVSTTPLVQDNGDFHVERDRSGEFARMFGINESVDILGASDTSCDRPEGPQRVAVRRAHSIESSNGSSLFDLDDRVTSDRGGAEYRARLHQPPSERAIENKLEAMDDLLKRIAMYGKKDSSANDNTENVPARDQGGGNGSEQTQYNQREQPKPVQSMNASSVPISNDGEGAIQPKLSNDAAIDQESKSAQQDVPVGGSSVCSGASSSRSNSDIIQQHYSDPYEEAIKRTVERHIPDNEDTKASQVLVGAHWRIDATTQPAATPSNSTDKRPSYSRRSSDHIASQTANNGKNVTEDERRLSLERLEMQLNERKKEVTSRFDEGRMRDTSLSPNASRAGTNRTVIAGLDRSSSVQGRSIHDPIVAPHRRGRSLQTKARISQRDQELSSARSGRPHQHTQLDDQVSGQAHGSPASSIIARDENDVAHEAPLTPTSLRSSTNTSRRSRESSAGRSTEGSLSGSESVSSDVTNSVPSAERMVEQAAVNDDIEHRRRSAGGYDAQVESNNVETGSQRALDIAHGLKTSGPGSLGNTRSIGGAEQAFFPHPLEDAGYITDGEENSLSSPRDRVHTPTSSSRPALQVYSYAEHVFDKDLATNSQAGPLVNAQDESTSTVNHHPPTFPEYEAVKRERLVHPDLLRRDANNLGSSTSSIRQYSLPLSDSFSSVGESLLGRDSVDTLSNRLVPIFPQPYHQSNETDTRGKNNQRQTANPQVEILVEGLVPQDSNIESPSDHYHSSNFVSQPHQDLRESGSRSTTAEASYPGRNNRGFRRALDADMVRRHHDSSGLYPREQQWVQDVSFSSDSSSDASAYMYLEKMRKMTGLTNSTQRLRSRSRLLHVSDSGSASSVEAPKRTVMQTEGKDPTGWRDSVASSSSSTPSIDARFQYLVNMAAVTGKALPLHLNVSSEYKNEINARLPTPPINLNFSSSDSDSKTSQGDQIVPDVEREEDEQKDDKTHARSVEEGFSRYPRHSASVMMFAPRDGIDCSIPPTPVFGSSSASYDFNRDKTIIDSSEERGDLQERNDPLPQFDLDDLDERLASLPPPPFGDLDMSQPPVPLPWIYVEEESQDEDSVVLMDRSDTPSDIVSSSSGALEKATSTGSPQRMGEALSVMFNEHGQQSLQGLSLADAFRARHPGFHRRAQSTDALLAQRREQLEQRRAAESEDDNLAQSKDAGRGNSQLPVSVPARGTTSSNKIEMHMPNSELLNRLATGQRAKISPEEMRERTCRLYNQLPEVTERKQQEDVLERRRQRLAVLREREKTRRQQKRQRQNQAP